MISVEPAATALTVAEAVEVPPVTESKVLNVPAVTTYFREVLGLLAITTPVAPLTVPVIVSPAVYVAVESAIVNVGGVGVVPIAADS